MRSYLALLIAATSLGSAGCGGSTNVTLAQLAESQQSYVGQHVLTRGVVRDERDPDGSTYFVLADPRDTLVGLEPAAAAIRFEGRFVQVSGLFEVKPNFGRLIHIVTIAPADDALGTLDPEAHERAAGLRRPSARSTLANGRTAGAR